MAKTEEPSDQKEIIIRATRGFRAPDLREVWRYRDLLWLLVWRDLASRYKQTILGPLWFIVQPLLTTVVFTLIFGKAAHLSPSDVPPVLFYLCGLLGWNYFALSFQSTSTTLVNNAGLFGKVYFPRLVVPISAVISNLLAFAIQFLTFLAFYLGYKLTGYHSTAGMDWTLVLLPLVLLQVAALSLGLGLWLAALTAKYRDFSIISGFIIQLWLYGTPVIYPLSRIPRDLRPLVAINPMTMPVECFRKILLGIGEPTPGLICLSVFITILSVVSGVAMFQHSEKSFVDVI